MNKKAYIYMVIKIVVLLFFIVQTILSGEYDFDPDQYRKKAFEVNGSVELNPDFLFLKRESPLYALKYKSDNFSYVDMYMLKGEFDASYSWRWIEMSGSGNVLLSYNNRYNSFDYDFNNYESFIKLSSEIYSLSLWLGKRVFKWGKGYVYNPTSFAARPKDLSDVDATQEGYWSVATELIKSFDSPLSNIAITAGMIPVYNEMNSGYLGENGLAGFVQMYMLLLNTDIDLVGYINDSIDLKFGAGISRNIIPNLEIHGEWAVSMTNETGTLTNLNLRDNPKHDFVAGVRYLSPFGTTIIADYFYNGHGADKQEIENYYSNIKSYNSGKKIADLQEQMKKYSGQFTMQDYFYLRIMQPEPFGILYLTPAAYAIVNIADHSFSAGLEFSYSRFTNTKLTLKYGLLYGDDYSEYGIKPGYNRINLKINRFF